MFPAQPYCRLCYEPLQYGEEVVCSSCSLEMTADPWQEQVTVPQGSFDVLAVSRSNQRLRQAVDLLGKGQSFMARPLGIMLAEKLLLRRPDVLMPLNQEESLEVGYSPSLVLTMEVANYWGLSVQKNNDNVLNKRVVLIGDFSAYSSVKNMVNSLFSAGVRSVDVLTLLALGRDTDEA